MHYVRVEYKSGEEYAYQFKTYEEAQSYVLQWHMRDDVKDVVYSCGAR